MAVTKQQIVLEIDADTGQVVKATTQLEKNFEKAAEAAGEVAKSTDDIGKNAEKSGGLLKKAGQIGADGFKLVGTAIAATGLLGLVTKVLMPIIDAFLENKKVADTLKVAMAGVGAVIDTIVDVGVKLVDVLTDAFTNPQAAVDGLKDKLQAVGDYIKTLIDTAVNPIQEKLLNMKRSFLEAAAGAKEFLGGDATELRQQIREVDDQLADLNKKQEENKEKLSAPFEKAAEAAKNFVKETKESTAQAISLEKAMQKLEDRERDLSVATAQASAQVEELKRQRDDERLSIEERIAAAEAAAAIDQRLANENVRIQEEKAALLAREIELQGETEDRLQALADAQIAAADARAASAGVQTELMTSLYGLNQELIEQGREQLEQLQETRDALNEAKAQAKEIENERLTQERGLMMSQRRQTEFIESESQKRRRIRQEEFEVFAEFVLKDQETMLNAGRYTLDMLSQLNESFTGDSEEQQRKGFERSKKIQAAQALISTFEATIASYKSVVGTPFVGPVLAPIAAAATAAIGFNNAQNIKNQQFQGGGQQPDTGGGGSLPSVGGPQGPGAPTLDLGFLGAGAGQSGPIQAYVLAENVSNAQQANQKIQDQATL
jgi:chemotaxis protein histidine kinase CheA